MAILPARPRCNLAPNPHQHALSGNSILLEYNTTRHFANIEAVFTYDGTDTIQSLIVSRKITGESAFAPR